MPRLSDLSRARPQDVIRAWTTDIGEERGDDGLISRPGGDARCRASGAAGSGRGEGRWAASSLVRSAADRGPSGGRTGRRTVYQGRVELHGDRPNVRDRRQPLVRAGGRIAAGVLPAE